MVVGRAEDTDDDIRVLLDGVAEIGAPGVPGPLCIYGSEAFPVIVGAIAEVRAPVMAADRWQAGRIVALGHDGYFSRPMLESLDKGRLIVNALRWSAGGESSDPRSGVVGAAELRTSLKERGHNVLEVSLTPDSLGTVDVVAVVLGNQRSRELEVLSEFVRDGGGLVTEITSWGWAQLHPHLDLVSDYAGNRLLAHVGPANRQLAQFSGLAVDLRQNPADVLLPIHSALPPGPRSWIEASKVTQALQLRDHTAAPGRFQTDALPTLWYCPSLKYSIFRSHSVRILISPPSGFVTKRRVVPSGWTASTYEAPSPGSLITMFNRTG